MDEDSIFNLLGGQGGPSHGFGGGGGIFNLFSGGGRAQRRRKGEDTVQPLPVSLEDLYKGKTTKLKLTKKVICADCNGRGGKEGAVQECARCRGNGRVMLTRQVGPGMIQQMQTQCDTCSGQGKIIDEKNKCKTCNGRRTIQDQKILEVVIAP
jgi:DnaJ family protein A protein 2